MPPRGHDPNGHGRTADAGYNAAAERIVSPASYGGANETNPRGRVQQIADWLGQLGLAQYAKRFAENHIGFAVLPDLTDQDLEKLGVLLGDRRKMLRAIAEFDGTPAAAASLARGIGAALTVSPLQAGPGTAGERRYLT